MSVFPIYLFSISSCLFSGIDDYWYLCYLITISSHLTILHCILPYSLMPWWHWPIPCPVVFVLCHLTYLTISSAYVTLPPIYSLWPYLSYSQPLSATPMVSMSSSLPNIGGPCGNLHVVYYCLDCDNSCMCPSLGLNMSCNPAQYPHIPIPGLTPT